MRDVEMVRTELFKESFYGYSNICYTLPDAIAWLQTLLAKVPSEYHDQSRFEIESDDNYEGGYNNRLLIYYDRPETSAEMKARDDEARQGRARYLEEQRARELATLAALQAKYGPA